MGLKLIDGSYCRITALRMDRDRPERSMAHLQRYKNKAARDAGLTDFETTQPMVAAIGGLEPFYTVQSAEATPVDIILTSAYTALKTLLEDAQLRQRMGTLGRHYVYERFTIAQITRKYLDLFDNILHKKADTP